MFLLDVVTIQDADPQWLADDCLRHAAFNYEKADVLSEAAACWRASEAVNFRACGPGGSIAKG